MRKSCITLLRHKRYANGNSVQGAFFSLKCFRMATAGISEGSVLQVAALTYRSDKGLKYSGMPRRVGG
jgi:hypothetical protein